MADNPYHQWLGLDSKIKNPHHFQLLGVSSKVVDPDSYRIQVLAAAQAKLEMLDRVEGAEKKQLVEKLKQRINTARDVLCDAQKRTDYVKQLKAQIAASKSAKMEGEEPPSDAGSKQETLRPPTNTPTIKSPPDSRPLSKTTGKVPAAPQPKQAETKSSAPPIPMAIPLSQPAQPSAATDKIASGEPSPIQAASPDVISDPADIDLSKLKFKKVGRKKRSKAIPVILALLSLGAIAGAYLIYTNSEKLEVIVRKAPKEISASPAITKVEPDDADTNNNATFEKNPSATRTKMPELAEIDMDALPTLDVDEVMEHPDTLSATNRNLKRQRAKAAQAKKRLAEAGEQELVPTSTADKIPSKTKFATDSESNRETKQLDPHQLAEYRTRMQRIRQSLLRRDRTTADMELQQVKEMFGSLLGSEFAIAPQQRKLKDLFDATNQSKELLDGFWKQTVKSCRGIPGGQEIQVGQQILGFVEADDRQVILRNAGANVTYEYEHLPPGLAVVLANQGAIEDVPTWRLQKAAFYSLYADQNPKYEDQVQQLVDLAENDGHDGSGLRLFLNSEIESIGAPAGRVDLPDVEQVAESMADFRAVHEYSDPSKLPSARADELAELLIDTHPDDLEQRLANLVEARELGIRAGNAYLVEDAILELEIWADLKKNELLTNAFLGLSKQKLDTAQARRLMDTVIPFLKSPEAKSANPQKVKKLIKRLMKIAEEMEFVDSMRRLRQFK